MSLVNLTNTDIFVKKLDFEDGTSQTEGGSNRTLDLYHIPDSTGNAVLAWNVGQVTNAYAVGIYQVHVAIQIFSPNDNELAQAQTRCVDATTGLEIVGSQWNFNTYFTSSGIPSTGAGGTRSIDNTYTFLWNNLSAANTFSFETYGYSPNAGFTYQTANGGLQIIKID
jgi:hypothetical protein